MKKIDPILHEHLTKLISSMGYVLLGCVLVPSGRKTVLRIYIDQTNGVTINDCEKVSRQVSAMLDVEDPFAGKYTLEVSSPGVDRPLFEKEHYQKYLGHRIKVRLIAAINGRRQYTGELKRIDDQAVYLWMEEWQQEMKLPFDMIEKANLIGDVHF